MSERRPEEDLGAVLSRSLGGPLGMAESTVPAVAFVVVLTASGQDVRLSATIAGGLAIVLAAARIVRRQTPIYALSGVLGVVIAGYIAARTGKAENFFLPGLLLNFAYAAGYAVSIAVRWPLIGVLVENLAGRGNGWRQKPHLLSAYSRVSWIWVGLFVTRVAVQLPLYLAGATVALGAARVGMGLPLFALGIWLSFLLLRRVEGAGMPGAPARPATDPPAA